MSGLSDHEAHKLLGAELQREMKRTELLRSLLLRARYEDVPRDGALRSEIDRVLFGGTGGEEL